MNLFATTMLAEVDGLHEEHVRVMTIGRIDALPEETRDAFAKAWEKTKGNDGMTLVVAVNYGARMEMLDAVRSCVDEARAALREGRARGACRRSRSRGTSTRPAFPTPTCSSARAARCACRTSCCGRSPMPSSYCTDVLWPDFDRYEFLRALLDYQGRDRRFGAVTGRAIARAASDGARGEAEAAAAAGAQGQHQGLRARTRRPRS